MIVMMILIPILCVMAILAQRDSFQTSSHWLFKLVGGILLLLNIFPISKMFSAGGAQEQLSEALIYPMVFIAFEIYIFCFRRSYCSTWKSLVKIPTYAILLLGSCALGMSVARIDGQIFLLAMVLLVIAFVGVRITKEKAENAPLEKVVEANEKRGINVEMPAQYDYNRVESLWNMFSAKYPVEANCITAIENRDLSTMTDVDVMQRLQSLYQLAQKNGCAVGDVKVVYLNSLSDKTSNSGLSARKILKQYQERINTEAMQRGVSPENTAAAYLYRWTEEYFKSR